MTAEKHIKRTLFSPFSLLQLKESGVIIIVQNERIHVIGGILL